MQIKKKSIAISLYVIILAVVAVGYWALSSEATKKWNDLSTWHVDQRLTLPQVATDLNVKLEGEIGKGDFTFTAPYCVLYEIVSDIDKATLKCSLLPYYYTVRQGEVPKDWSEKSDIALVITKNDAEPTEFLGRIDKSFVSISSLGSSVLPVSLQVTGHAAKPAETLVNKLEHLRKVYAKEKDEFIVTISTYGVARLDKATEKEKAEYAKAWLKSASQEIDDHVRTVESAKLSSQPYLNSMRESFKYERKKCHNLNTCEYEYPRNAAEKFLYTVYGWEAVNPKAFDVARNTMLSSLYPFSEIRKGKTGTGTATCPTCTPDWTEMSAYTFPICPINDVISGKKSKNYELFSGYVTTFIAKSVPMPKNEKEAIDFIDKQIPLIVYATTGEFDIDMVDSVNIGCHYLLENGVANYPKLKAKVVDTYFKLLSISVGKEVLPTKQSLDTIIYESTAYSPYKTAYVSDFGVAKYRELVLEKSDESAKVYLEWRSLLHTAIFIYLLNGNY